MGRHNCRVGQAQQSPCGDASKCGGSFDCTTGQDLEPEGIIEHRHLATRTPKCHAEARPVYRNGKDLHDGKAVLQDIMRKYKDVNCVDKQNLVWNTDLIETMELENLIGQAAQGLYSGEARHESRGAHAHEDFPDRNDVDWMKHTLSRLDAKHVEDAKVVLEYREVIDQPLDDQMHHVHRPSVSTERAAYQCTF